MALNFNSVYALLQYIKTDFISLHSSVLDVTVKLHPDKYKFHSCLTEAHYFVKFEFLILASAYP